VEAIRTEREHEEEPKARPPACQYIRGYAGGASTCAANSQLSPSFQAKVVHGDAGRSGERAHLVKRRPAAAFPTAA
jgi:hypothetical protein